MPFVLLSRTLEPSLNTSTSKMPIQSLLTSLFLKTREICNSIIHQNRRLIMFQVCSRYFELSHIDEHKHFRDLNSEMFSSIITRSPLHSNRFIVYLNTFRRFIYMRCKILSPHAISLPVKYYHHTQFAFPRNFK